MAATTSSLDPADMAANDTSGASLVSVSSSQHIPGEYPGSASRAAVEPVDPRQLSLTQALYARRAEYTSPRSIKVKVGTWNVAAFKDTEKDIGAWFTTNNKPYRPSTSSRQPSATPSPSSLHPGEHASGSSNAPSISDNHEHGPDDGVHGIGIYVLGLQEVVDINSAVEAFRPFSTGSNSIKFKTALENAMPPGYRFVAEQQLVGLLLMVYAAPEIAPHIHSVSTSSTGTGLMGYMGNKGAVAARIVLGETTRLVFINSHLSSGLGKTELQRRNWDAAQITSRLHFEPIADTFGASENLGERLGEEDFAFWFGDLNFRLEGVPGEDMRRILMLHIANMYGNDKASQNQLAQDLNRIEAKLPGSDISTLSLSQSTPSSNEDYEGDGEHEHGESSFDDPTSLQAILNSLLPHDELHQQQKAGKAFHDGWREGSINFLPTYKYDVGSHSKFDSGEKKRAPSWCDRILYRTRKDRLAYEKRVAHEREAKERDNQMTTQGIASAAEDENTMFEYDPEADGDEDYDDRSTHSDLEQSHNGLDEDSVDTLCLDSYTSHQEILTSDHKPLDCVFTLTYDAVDFERHSKVQNEIARELDRAENEGRPVVTVIVEGASQVDDPDFNGAHFGNVRYDDPKTCFVTIANTGSVPAHFGFVDHPQQSQDPNSLSSWLSIHFHYPSDGQDFKARDVTSKKNNSDDSWSSEVSKVFDLEPGDATTVDLLCHVKDKNLVKRLNDGDNLEDILVLRVKDGRDHFLPVKGSWRSSVQGRTIDRLVRLPEGGVRALQIETPDRPSNNDEPSGQNVMWSAPREIFRLTEAIEQLAERITAEWSMLGTHATDGSRPPLATYAGWPFVEESWTLDRDTMQRLRVDINEALDTDRSFDSILSSRLPPLHRLEVFADTLLDFLNNLEDGVIPASLWEQLNKDFFSKEKLKNKLSVDDKRGAVLEILSSSQAHSISFVLLTSMLARISQDVVGAVAGSQPDDRSSIEITESPRIKIKRKSLDPDPAIATKTLIQKNFSAVFADVLVRNPETHLNKSSSASTTHKRELIEIFLESTT